MVTVGDIGTVDLSEEPDPGGGVSHPPDPVPHPVGGEVIERGTPGTGREETRQLRVVRHGQKDRLGMGIEGQDVPGPVVFLVGPGLLVLADDIGRIVIDVDTPDHPDLGPPVHDQFVEEEGPIGIGLEHAIPEQPVEIGPGSVVHPVIVGTGVGRQVNIRAADMQKAERVPLSEKRRLVP